MNFTPDVIIFFVLLVDSAIANGIAWVGRRWYMEHFQIMSRYVPLTRAWAAWYLVLVLWAGSILLRMGVL